MLLWCFLTDSVEKHDNIQIINSLVPVEFTTKIAGPLQNVMVIENLMPMKQIKGVVDALMTPMFADGSIDWESTEALIDFTTGHGVGQLSAGTTSESPTIQDEQERIDKLVVKRAKGNVPVIIGAGSNDTAHAVKLTKRAVDNGADATLHVMGYYNNPSQRGVIDYFDQIVAAAPDTPVVMYNIPGRGAAAYHPSVIVHLAKRHANINGLKEASPDAIAVARDVRRLADAYSVDISILSGDDDRTYEMNEDGVVSVMANLVPSMYQEMVQYMHAGDMKAAGELNEILRPLNNIVGIKTTDSVPINVNGVPYDFPDTYKNPQPVKVAAYLLGMTPELGFRSPMVTPPRDIEYRVGHALVQVYEATDGEAFRDLETHCKPYPNVERRLAPYRDAI